MLKKTELLKHPNYLLTNYQLEIYRQLATFMQNKKMKKKDMAKKLGVTNSYVSQILKGEFNFTLKKLVELGLAIEKVPFLEFINPDEYWRREKEGTIKYVVKNYTYHVEVESSLQRPLFGQGLTYIDYKGGMLPKSVTKTETINQ